MVARLSCVLISILLAHFGFAQNSSTGTVETAQGVATELRLLDKVAGKAIDVTLQLGDAYTLGKLRIIMGECRYPVANPAGDAYAFLTILSQDLTKEYFSGWMIASSPALNALDHVRYDVWPLRCTIS